MTTVSKAWLGLGGNIGDVPTAMANALQRLDGDADVTVTAVSPIYKTPPWGVEDQPWFHNCCAEVETSLTPEQLLEACQEAEREGKRERIVRWGPRTIDVDILVFDGVEQNEQRLTLPHPRMLERAFVIIPLADIAPNLHLKDKPCQIWASEMESSDLELTSTNKDWWNEA
jgi:2-amino-4-hydroxy-6-hydroxymethyldihydropteridine diphosphokinase